jgi:hypothetical protein
MRLKRLFKSILAAHLFLGVYVATVLATFAVSYGALALVIEKEGIVPYALSLVHYGLVPLLMWSIWTSNQLSGT